MNKFQEASLKFNKLSDIVELDNSDLAYKILEEEFNKFLLEFKKPPLHVWEIEKG